MTARRHTRAGSIRVKGSVAASIVLLGLLAMLLGGTGPSNAQSDFYEATFRVRGTATGEFVDVSWESDSDSGQIAEMFFQDTDWHELSGYVPGGATTVRITFHNDGLNDDGSDRNVIVDWFEINGVRIETESDDVYSVGVYDGVDCEGGFRNSEFLACNGYFEFDVDGLIDPPSGDDRIVITAQGSTGTETMAIEVDGEVRRIWPVGPGTADYVYDGPIVTPDQQLRVLFTNDGLTETGDDRNLHVLLIDVYGEVFDPIALESKGVWNGTDCGIGYRNSNWLHLATGGSTCPEPPSHHPHRRRQWSSPSSPLEPWATNWSASRSMGSCGSLFELDVGLYEYTMLVPRPAYDSFRLLFLNDGLGAGGLDRNVYVDSFVLDGGGGQSARARIARHLERGSTAESATAAATGCTATGGSTFSPVETNLHHLHPKMGSWWPSKREGAPVRRSSESR